MLERIGVFETRDPEKELVSLDGLNDEQRELLKKTLADMLGDPEITN